MLLKECFGIVFSFVVLCLLTPTILNDSQDIPNPFKSKTARIPIIFVAGAHFNSFLNLNTVYSVHYSGGYLLNNSFNNCYMAT